MRRLSDKLVFFKLVLVSLCILVRAPLWFKNSACVTEQWGLSGVISAVSQVLGRAFQDAFWVSCSTYPGQGDDLIGRQNNNSIISSLKYINYIINLVSSSWNVGYIQIDDNFGYCMELSCQSTARYNLMIQLVESWQVWGFYGSTEHGRFELHPVAPAGLCPAVTIYLLRAGSQRSGIITNFI